MKGSVIKEFAVGEGPRTALRHMQNVQVFGDDAVPAVYVNQDQLFADNVYGQQEGAKGPHEPQKEFAPAELGSVF
jgi:hypothetical protein